MIEAVILWSCAGVFALALIVTLGGVWRLRRLRRALAESATWVPVDAVVVDSRVERRGAVEYSSYQPVVVYDYAVGGMRYRGSALGIGPPVGYSFERGARRAAARFEVGSRVTAWVDPADPRRAALERRTPFRKTVVVLLVLLWAVTLAGIAVLLFAPGIAGPGPALKL